jgi:hypothetical protein
MSEAISRRKLFGWLAAAAIAVTAPALVPEEAEAQTVGMERRHGRRVGRRMGRRTRRLGRHAARRVRRTIRRGGM